VISWLVLCLSVSGWCCRRVTGCFACPLVAGRALRILPVYLFLCRLVAHGSSVSSRIQSWQGSGGGGVRVFTFVCVRLRGRTARYVIAGGVGVGVGVPLVDIVTWFRGGVGLVRAAVMSRLIISFLLCGGYP